jgi:hypothetical protein
MRQQTLLLFIVLIVDTRSVLVVQLIPGSDLLDADHPKLHIDLTICLEQPGTGLQATHARIEIQTERERERQVE